MARVKTSRRGSATYDVGLLENGRLHTAMVDAATEQNEAAAMAS